MSAQPISSKMSESEYLTFERASEFKHEYVNGEILDMAGASTNHVVICTYTASALVAALKGKACTVYQIDMRIKASFFHSYRYPDIVVVCGKAQYTDDKFDTITNPTVIIEILSPSTEIEDKVKKLREYRQIESLQEYLIISQDSPLVERYLRQDHGNWLYSEISGIESSIKLPSLEISLAFADIFEKAEFGEGSSEA